MHCASAQTMRWPQRCFVLLVYAYSPVSLACSFKRKSTLWLCIACFFFCPQVRASNTEAQLIQDVKQAALPNAELILTDLGPRRVRWRCSLHGA